MEDGGFLKPYSRFHRFKNIGSRNIDLLGSVLLYDLCPIPMTGCDFLKPTSTLQVPGSRKQALVVQVTLVLKINSVFYSLCVAS